MARSTARVLTCHIQRQRQGTRFAVWLSSMGGCERVGVNGWVRTSLQTSKPLRRELAVIAFTERVTPGGTEAAAGLLSDAWGLGKQLVHSDCHAKMRFTCYAYRAEAMVSDEL